MKLLIKFPTRQRPQKFLKVLKKYVDFMTGDDYKIIVSCDNDDDSMREEYVLEKLKSYKNLEIFFGDNNSKMEAINANMDNQEFDIVLLASDDMIPTIKGYDDIIRDEMKNNFPDTDGILWFHDGHRTDLNTLCILGKKYYERFNYIYHPDYRSFFSDNEFTEVGNILKKQVFIDKIIIEHQHPVWGFNTNDELYNKNLVHYYNDEQIFKDRKNKNFNL